VGRPLHRGGEKRGGKDTSPVSTSQRAGKTPKHFRKEPRVVGTAKIPSPGGERKSSPSPPVDPGGQKGGRGEKTIKAKEEVPAKKGSTS